MRTFIRIIVFLLFCGSSIMDRPPPLTLAPNGEGSSLRAQMLSDIAGARFSAAMQLQRCLISSFCVTTGTLQPLLCKEGHGEVGVGGSLIAG